ncbi:IclR family transcriptional regulator [Neisseria sp. ZJ106]|uniref:IclR family transcriptional regulator n=1 Tax=Neisseria lisongii TaxID=2912188 RepID=A0AAW5AGT5_9NEIS|nr:IclR family transcriptional regulator [Neisseria lisongii]MCF7520783.1 IclR family transcriptional regulator [Neisseria lisongii]MCF7529302.1 IclR family transcriptional regulator [Neisseria lisongii]WCL70721.1 IclR family transcriptional regulator [Neisseria lisongii]
MKTATTAPALERAIRILNLLTQAGSPLSGADIAKQLALPRSSVHGLLMQLLQTDLIRKTDERHFVLGAHTMYWANGFLAQQNIVNDFQTAISRIPELDSYTLTLSALSGNQVVYLACRNSQQAPLGFEFRMGMQLPAVFTATGKVMLSTLPQDEILQLLPELPPPYTETSVRNHEELFAELETVRRQGYAVDNGQLRLGMHCFGVAVTDYSGRAGYGIAVSLIEREVNETNRSQLVSGLKKLAQSLSASLGSLTRSR